MSNSRSGASNVEPGDEILLTQVIAGENEALSALYERHSMVVYGMALRILGQGELAEDIVQETFWRVWRRGESYQSGRGQVSTWIFSIAHNLCIDELRRIRTRPMMLTTESEQAVQIAATDLATDAPAAALARERRQIIVEALAQIPSEQRQIIELAYFGGLSQSEIAERLQSPIGTVKTRARLALQKLRDALGARKLGIEDLTE